MVGELFIKFDNPDNVKPIYEGNIDSIKAVANPILRPVLQYNEFYRSTMVRISKELSLYISNKEIFEKMISSNKIYQSTLIYGIFIQLLNSSANVINDMSLLLSNDKSMVNDMINISRQDYLVNREYLSPKEMVEEIEAKEDAQQKVIEQTLPKKEKVDLIIDPNNPYKASIATKIPSPPEI